MRITVVPIDKVIVVDGNGVVLENWTFDDSHIHAIQWVHDHGHIELKTNDPNIEIDDLSVVQPYIDAYMQTISVVEENLLKEKEEERLRLEREEREKILEEEKKRKEQEEVQKIIDQNKKIREEKMRLELEHSTMLEDFHNQKMNFDIQLKRKEFEKEVEVETAKNQKILDLIREKDDEFLKKYDTLLSQLDEKKDLMEQEQKSFIELIREKEKNIDLEREQHQEKVKLFDRDYRQKRDQLELERNNLEDQRMQFLTEKDYQNEYIKNLQEVVALESKKLNNMRELHAQEYKLESDNLAQKQKEYYEQIDKLIELQNDLSKTQSEIESYKLAELDSEKQYIDSIFDGAVSSILQEQKNAAIDTLNKDSSYQDVSVEELSAILDELDPEKVYTTLTSGEFEDNNFPVEKAVVWFSALKQVMDKNSEK